MRLFLGIPVPAGPAWPSVTRALAQALPGFRPVPAATHHITLRFLGEVLESRGLEDAVSHALAGRPALPAVVEGVGAFPSPKAARVLWAGARSPGIEALVQAIEDATRSFGEPPEPRRFVAHATLGRLRRPVDARAILAAHKDTLFAEGRLDRVVLFESTLASDGPHYDVVREWRLAAGA